MKRWTVMLIPEGRGSTQNFALSTMPLWFLGGFILVLTFAFAFMFQRHQVMSERSMALRASLDALKLEARTLAPAQQRASGDGALGEREEKLRAAYEKSLAAITEELGVLYDMEAKARDITGLAPRAAKQKIDAENVGGGKGGSPAAAQAFSYVGEDEGLRPPHVIYGMAQPSADLILEEILLRTESFRHLVGDMEVEIDRIERVPSIWPLAGRAGYVSSRFGMRRDPFTKRLRHHNGVDISARAGTPVMASAKGTVVASGKDRYLGNVVKVGHGNGTETWYAHLQESKVKKGDRVQRHDIIGLVGSTGRSTGSHLHYEVHVGGKPVNGQKYITE